MRRGVPSVSILAFVTVIGITIFVILPHMAAKFNEVKSARDSTEIALIDTKTAAAAAMGETREFYGVVQKIKRTKPYPFTTSKGQIWECKMRIGYWEQDPETGEWEWEIYTAYPIRGSGYEWACAMKKDTAVKVKVASRKDTDKGDILYIEEV